MQSGISVGSLSARRLAALPVARAVESRECFSTWRHPCTAAMLIFSMSLLLPAATRCEMVLHQALRARHVRKNGIGGEVRHGVTSGVSRETSLNKHVTPHLHMEYAHG